MTAALPTASTIAVIGAGAMGAGIAQVAAVAGHRVQLLDNRPGAAADAIRSIQAQISKLADKGKLSPERAAQARSNLVAVQQLSDLAGTSLVIEAIVENLQAKQNLYAELEGIVGENCIFGTNTSSISVTAIGAALKRPQRLAGLHFFNPAPVMALVEIVSGLATDPAVAATLFATATAWGKTAVHAKSTPGFIVNRVARPYYGEALRLLTEGAADCATIDAVMREAGGFRMGPFELMDMIGHDVNYAVTCSVWNAFYNDPRFLPSLVQKELLDAGFLGKKSGRGFYDYREGASKPAAQTEGPRAIPTGITLCGDSAAAQALAQRLTQATIPFDTAPTADGRIAQVNGAVLFVTDGRSATQRAADSGLANVVLVDLALDYATATRLAMTCAAQCSDGAADAAIGLLQAAGLQVSRLADIPGLAVMRTVAMLANEAADAVYQGVCSATAADAAMRLGVNYPKGPLAWADAVGLPTIRTVLTHLGASYGEDRYRLSPLLQRHVFAGKTIHG
ncbi:3-hydroxyacyl-CoA dehydrogenase PaaC [Rhodoferax sp. AJA081-3]|uniref:3-hydroxyacyl-CoA dehydrogenase PaaH n=1 Tax=Rhodoferax sp. AJA081-3 TaxID=2752316 RepID=UPI001ADFF1DE|nr:3-hydroxyacyl-CoA dehydrogenase PaaH [Rhodoferax sp. AJA081-3]QTN28232.1 3-hydroxyacyl-CoA dehydrogenase PaaC [Rhodoferax sp. AJA081-3]